MTCPDDARLDLWLDDALPAVEAAALTVHTVECLRCTAQVAERQAEEQRWRRALALDASELAYLHRARLVAVWQPPVARPILAAWWPVLLVFGLMASYLAWLAMLHTLEELGTIAGRLGLPSLLLAGALGGLRELGRALADLPSGPGLVDPVLLMAGGSFLLWLLVTRPWHLLRSDT
jgi:hypothetical protein